MTEATFAAGMAALAEMFPHRTVTPELLDVYRVALRDLSDAEFQRAVETCLTESRYFPVAAVLREAARPLPSAGAISLLFDRIEAMAHHDPVSGPWWSLREVQERHGAAAAEAFAAAGGSSAFAAMYEGNNRAFTLKRFSEAFLEAERAGVRAELVGPAPERLQGLIGATAKVLAFPAKEVRKLPPGRGGSRAR